MVKVHNGKENGNYWFRVKGLGFGVMLIMSRDGIMKGFGGFGFSVGLRVLGGGIPTSKIRTRFSSCEGYGVVLLGLGISKPPYA